VLGHAGFKVLTGLAESADFSEGYVASIFRFEWLTRLARIALRSQPTFRKNLKIRFEMF
jgi:hypothetical protein